MTGLGRFEESDYMPDSGADESDVQGALEYAERRKLLRVDQRTNGRIGLRS